MSPLRCPTSTAGQELPIRLAMDWPLVEGRIGSDMVPGVAGVGRTYVQNTCKHRCSMLWFIYMGLNSVLHKSQASPRRSSGSIRSWQGCSGLPETHPQPGQQHWQCRPSSGLSEALLLQIDSCCIYLPGGAHQSGKHSGPR